MRLPKFFTVASALLAVTISVAVGTPHDSSTALDGEGTVLPFDPSIALSWPGTGEGRCGWLEFVSPGDAKTYRVKLEDRPGWCYTVPGWAHQYLIKDGCKCWFHPKVYCGGKPREAVAYRKPLPVDHIWWEYLGFTCTVVKK